MCTTMSMQEKNLRKLNTYLAETGDYENMYSGEVPTLGQCLERGHLLICLG